MLLKDLSPLKLHDLFIFMKERGKRYAARKMKQVLSSACSNAVRWELIPYNPVTKAKIDPAPEKERKILSADEARAFLSVCDNLPIEIALLTGMRPSETVALRWKDVDFKNKTIFVTQSLVRMQGGGFEFKPPKSKKSIRRIVISDDLIQKLKLHKKAQSEMIEYRKSKNLAFENLDLVFSSRFGSPLSANNLNYRELKIILEKAGLSNDYSLYSLRHSLCSILSGRGANLKDVSQRMGHADVRITLKTYAHSLPGADAALTDLFSRIIEENNVIPNDIIETSEAAN